MQWVWEATSKIAAAPLASVPWRHLNVASVFPDDFYREMLRHLPSVSSMRRLSWATPNRHLLGIHGVRFHRADSPPVPAFWRGFARKFFPSLRCTLETTFGVRGRKEAGALVYDTPGYSLVPHTDTPDRLITAVFYLPADDASADQGTILMRGREPDPEGMGHAFDDRFDPVKVVPCAPNSALFFERSDWSYHAVGETHTPRWSMSFDVFR
jgi:hypothetical protein